MLRWHLYSFCVVKPLHIPCGLALGSIWASPGSSLAMWASPGEERAGLTVWARDGSSLAMWTSPGGGGGGGGGSGLV